MGGQVMTETTATTATATALAVGLGRRKEAVARVRLRPDAGGFTVNGKPAEQYFRSGRELRSIRLPLSLSKEGANVGVHVNVRGGGPTGQAGAISLGIARALCKLDPESEPKLRAQGFLTRDSRMVERKKYGQPKARRRFQYSKR